MKKMIRQAVRWGIEFNQKVDRNEATLLEMLAVIGVGAIGCAVWSMLYWIVSGAWL